MAEILSPGVKLAYVKTDPHLDQEKTADIEASARSDTNGFNGGPDSDELLSGEGKTWSRWAVDQVRYAADGVVSNSVSEKILKDLKETSEGDKSWSQWAAKNAIAAKDAATSNVKYVKDVAASGLSNVAGHSSDAHSNGEGRMSVTQSVLHKSAAMKETISSGLSHAAGQSPKGTKEKTLSVQDAVDRYCTTAAPSAGAQQTLTKQVIDTGLGIKDGIAIHLGYGPDPHSPAGTRAAAIKEQAKTKTAVLKSFTPGPEEKELSKVITESLSHLPELLKENVWASSNGHKAETTPDGAVPLNSSSTSETSSTSTGGLVNRVADVVSSASEVVTSYLPTTVSSYLPGRQTVPQDPLTPPSSEPTKDHEVTFEDKLEKIEDEKLMELWTIGNAPLDFTINTASLETESCFSPHTAKPPKAEFDPEAQQHDTQFISKDEVFAEAHRERVRLEAKAYLEAELRKADAHAQKMLAKAEKHRLDEEAKALETLKKEELRAELAVHSAEVKMEKILAHAKSRAVSMRAGAEENYAKNLAEAKTKAERWKAEIEETRRKEFAELHDRVERMIIMEELPAPPEHRGVVQKVKERVFCHLKP